MENSTTNTAGFNSVSYSIKPSKSAIIQRLLDEKLITVEEAMTLMEYHQLMPIQPVMPLTYPYPGKDPYSPPFNPSMDGNNNFK